MIEIKSLIAQEKKNEGFSPFGYRDTEGVLTVGYGRNIDDERGGYGIRPVEADFMLTNDLNECDKLLCEWYSWYQNMSAARCNAVCGMLFNLGPKRFSSSKKMIDALSKADYKTASAELLDSVYSKQVGQRAVRYADAIRNG